MGLCSVVKRWSNERKGWCTRTGRKKGWVTAAIYLDLFHHVRSFTFMLQHRCDRKSLFTFTLSIPFIFSITLMYRYYNTYGYGIVKPWWHQCCFGWQFTARKFNIAYGPDRKDGSQRLWLISYCRLVEAFNRSCDKQDEVVDTHYLNCIYHPDFMKAGRELKLRVTEHRRRYFIFNRSINIKCCNYFKVEVLKCSSDEIPLRSLIVRYGKTVDSAVQAYIQTLYLLQSR